MVHEENASSQSFSERSDFKIVIQILTASGYTGTWHTFVLVSRL